MNKAKNRPYIVLSVIAGLLFLIAALIKPTDMTTEQFAYDAVLNLAFIIITIVVVNLIWLVLGGDPIENLVKDGLKAYELCTDGFKTGLMRAHGSSSEYATTKKWLEILNKAESQVDLMGYSLYTWTRSDEFIDSLETLAKKNVQIRILIMDTANPYFGAGLNTSELSAARLTDGEIALCSKFVEKAIERLPAAKKENIKLLFIRTGIPEMQIVRIDGIVYVTPYMYSKNTSDSPLFVCKKQEKSYFDKYSAEFEMLWKLNSKNTGSKQ